MDLDLRHAGARVRSLKAHVNWLCSSMAVEKRRFNAKPTLELKIVESLEDVVLDFRVERRWEHWYWEPAEASGKKHSHSASKGRTGTGGEAKGGGKSRSVSKGSRGGAAIQTGRGDSSRASSGSGSANQNENLTRFWSSNPFVLFFQSPSHESGLWGSMRRCVL